MVSKKRKASRNGRGSPKDLPKGMRPVTRTGGDPEEVQKEFRSIGGILRVGENQEYLVAILQSPAKWTRFEEHTVNKGGRSFVYVPCMGRYCAVCRRLPDNKPRTYALVPLWVYENKAAQFFRAPGGTHGDLVGKHTRYKNKEFLNSQWILVRDDGSGVTSYDFEIQRKRVPTSIKAKIQELPDIDEMLISRYRSGLDSLSWDDEDTFSSGVDSDDFEDDEEEDEDDDDTYDHEEDDEEEDEDGDENYSREDIFAMKKNALLEVIDDESLPIIDAEKMKAGSLRKAVWAEIESQMEIEEDEDDEDEEDDEEMEVVTIPKRRGKRK